MRKYVIMIVMMMVMFGMSQAWALDIQHYAEQKAKGLVSIARNIDGFPQITSKRFDPVTGVEQQPQVETISPSQLRDMISQAKNQLDSLETIKADVDASK